MLSPSQQIIRNINGIRNSSNNSNHLYKAERSNRKLPLFERPKEEKINAKYSKLDLNEYLIKDPDNTFLIRVQGESMIGAGINTGDILVVDKNEKIVSGKIVVAAINGELTVKKLLVSGNKMHLESANSNFPAIQINSEDDFDIWGVVRSIIKPV